MPFSKINTTTVGQDNGEILTNLSMHIHQSLEVYKFIEDGNKHLDMGRILNSTTKHSNNIGMYLFTNNSDLKTKHNQSRIHLVNLISSLETHITKTTLNMMHRTLLSENINLINYDFVDRVLIVTKAVTSHIAKMSSIFGNDNYSKRSSYYHDKSIYDRVICINRSKISILERLTDREITNIIPVNNKDYSGQYGFDMGRLVRNSPSYLLNSIRNVFSNVPASRDGDLYAICDPFIITDPLEDLIVTAEQMEDKLQIARYERSKKVYQ